MYREFYGFKDKPYSLSIDKQFFYSGDTHRGILDTLKQNINTHDLLCVMTGKVGVGKSTLIHYLADNLGDEITSGLLSASRISSDKFIPGLLAAFNQPSSGSTKELTKAFGQYVVTENNGNKHLVLIIDDAQNMSIEMLNILYVLIDKLSNNRQGLTTILVGEPALLENLNQSGLEHLSNKISSHCELKPLTYDETVSYIRHRNKIAGGKSGIFEDSACKEIYEQTKGVPRSINLLCDSALVYGYIDEKQTITESIISRVTNDKKEGKLLPALVKAEEIAKERGQQEEQTADLKTEEVEHKEEQESMRIMEDKEARMIASLDEAREKERSKLASSLTDKINQPESPVNSPRESPVKAKPETSTTVQSGAGKKRHKPGLLVALVLVIAAIVAGYMFASENMKTTISEMVASGMTVFENQDLKKQEELKARELERAATLKSAQEKQQRKAAELLAIQKAKEQERKAALKARQEEARIKKIQETERLKAEEERKKAALEVKLERAALLKAKRERSERLKQEEAARMRKSAQAEEKKALEEAARKKAEEEALKLKKQELVKQKQTSIERAAELEAIQKNEAYKKYMEEIQQLETTIGEPFE